MSRNIPVNQRIGHLITEHTERDTPKTDLERISGAFVLDAGVERFGSIEAGILLARICMGDLAKIRLVPCDGDANVSDNGVFVQTDRPLRACLGCQYAGWPVQTDDFFAMGSGPMRMLRGKEEILLEHGLTESARVAVGVVESDKLPTHSAIELIADECGVKTEQVAIAVAPSTSIAGSLQVVARSVETALHKLHAIGFDVAQIVSATGFAPLPPPAKPGDTVAGIGRTNDAMLYGARVTIWTESDDRSIEKVIEQVPSSASKDYGQPFAKVFQDYEYDFYKVDPLLFSPAVITISNLRTGRTFSAGQTNREILRESFLS